MQTFQQSGHLRALFVGGLHHGKTEYVADDVNTLELADLSLEAGRQMYAKHQWQRADAVHGFDALFINSFVPLSEYESKIQSALDEANRAAELAR